MTFNKRILKLIELENITRHQFEKSIGVSENYSYKIKNPTLDIIDNILKAYPRINREWLVFNDGDPYSKAYKMPITGESSVNDDHTDYVTKPLIELKAELLSKDIIIRTLAEKVKQLEGEAENLRQQRNNYRNTPTRRKQDSLHNKGSSNIADKRFNPK